VRHRTQGEGLDGRAGQERRRSGQERDRAGGAARALVAGYFGLRRVGGGQVVHLDHAVCQPGGGERVASGGDSRNRRGQGRRRHQRLAVGGVPEANRLVVGAGDQLVSIGG